MKSQWHSNLKRECQLKMNALIKRWRANLLSSSKERKINFPLKVNFLYALICDIKRILKSRVGSIISIRKYLNSITFYWTQATTSFLILIFTKKKLFSIIKKKTLTTPQHHHYNLHGKNWLFFLQSVWKMKLRHENNPRLLFLKINSIVLCFKLEMKISLSFHTTRQ